MPLPLALDPFQLDHFSLPSQMPASPHAITIRLGLNCRLLQLIANGFPEVLPLAARATDGTAARHATATAILSALRMASTASRRCRGRDPFARHGRAPTVVASLHLPARTRTRGNSP